MDLRSLRYFVAIAETTSFSRAAERLHRSQPGLSRSVRELEAEFGVELFERVGRRVILRPEGKQLLGKASRLLADADELLKQAKLLASGRSLIIRVGGASNTLERVMPEVLRLYRRRWGDVEVQLTSEGGSALLAAVEKGELDVAIARVTHSDLLQSRFAFPTHVIAIVDRRHRLAQRRSITIRELDGERLLVPPPNFTSRALLNFAFDSEAIRPYIALESHDLNTLVALAEASQGVAIVPSTVDTAAHAVQVLAILRAGQPLGSSNGLVWPRRRLLPPHVTGFIELAVRHLERAYPGKNLRLPRLPDLDVR
jgi:DNA-binding transcriptional LysR family regulator